MSEIDDKTKQALSADDAELYQELSSRQSIFGMVADSFRNASRWLVIFAIFWGMVFMAAGIHALLELLAAENVRDQILWATALILSVLGVAFMKVWYWMELNKNAITREIKRVELQIASLARRCPFDDPKTRNGS